MTRDKTKIWRGGLEGLLDRTAAEVARTATATVAHTAAERPSGDSQGGNASVGSLTRVGSAVSVGSATRVMPVERLLAGEQAATHAPRNAERESGARPVAPASSPPALASEHDDVPDVIASLREARARTLRRAAMAVLGVAIVVLALRPAPPPKPPAVARTRGTASSGAQAAEASAPTPPGSSIGAAGTRPATARAPLARTDPATVMPPPAPTAPPGLERRAVDALVSGDRLAAAQLYARLAAAQPDRRVFAEAARILDVRARMGEK